MGTPQGKIVVVLGVNPSGVLRTLELDANDLLKVALASPATFDTHVHGYDPTTWRPLLVDSSGRAIIVGTGTSGRVPVSVAEALPAGTNNIGDVDVVSSALPSGAATSANQSTEITALQLIDDLRNALATVATDKLRASIVDALVAGSSRIGSVGIEGWIGGAWQKNPLQMGYSGTIMRGFNNTSLSAGTSNTSDTAVPAGEIWVITQAMVSVTSVTVTTVALNAVISGNQIHLIYKTTPVSGIWYPDNFHVILAEGDFLRVTVFGATLNDDVFVNAAGYRVDIDQ